MPPPTDDFCVFREHAARSVKEMSDDMLLSVRRIVEMVSSLYLKYQGELAIQNVCLVVGHSQLFT